MSGERREMIERIFLEAVELDPTAASALLDRRCEGDAELRHEVESLLGFASRAERFLDHQELVELTPELVRSHEESLAPGTMVGVYRVERIIGTGGMGIVYVAQQDRPRRTVALKLVNALIASPSVRRRFELEAEVLGRLQHPGIAQVFEAGAAQIGGGEVRRPFIAMELVEGSSISEHCETNALSHSARVALMVKVCDAVQHAHQRGVIHRDLKPANILVTGEGQPKILDFGVARASDVGRHITTIATGVGQLIGTLPYMSPEQVLGDPQDIDTRTDVYSLGVILYELLAKRLPLDVSGRSLPEAVRTIRQDEPARLSAVSRVFRSDLDTITAKALEKNKSRRYQTAAELGEDLQRFLEGRPINAKDDSALYVLRKQISRYRGAVAVAAAGLVALVAFAVYAATQARTQRHLAEMERRARVEADNARDTASARAAELRRSLYVSAIGFAQAAHSSHDATRVERVLESCPRDLRGWEWRYLRTASDTSASMVPLPNVDWNLRISRDGRLACLMVPGYAPKVIDTRTGLEIARVEPSEAVEVGSIFSDDGGTLLIGDLRGRLRIVSTRTCRERSVQVTDGWFVRPMALIPSMNAAVVHYGIVPGTAETRVISLEDGRTLSTLIKGEAYTVDIAPDEQSVAMSTFEHQTLLAPLDGSSPPVELHRHDHVIRAVAFSPDGATIASASHDGAVYLVPIDGGEIRSYRVFENKATSLAWRPDGSALAVGGTEGIIQILRPSDGEVLSTLMGHGGWIGLLSWNAVDDTLTSLSGDQSIRTWRTPTVPHQPRYSSDEGFVSGAWSRSGERVYLGGARGSVTSLRGTDLGDPRTLLNLGAYVTEIELSPDGTLLTAASEAGRVVVMDLVSESIVSEWRSPASRAIDVDFDPTGARVLMGSDTPGMTIWDARTGALLTHKRGVPSAMIRGDWSPDGSIIAAAYYDNVVRIHDARSGNILNELYGPNLWIAEVRFIEGGAKVMASSDDGNVYVWEALKGGPPRIAARNVRGIYGLSLSPDGTRVATGGFDNTIRLFDSTTGEELLMFRRHTSAVWVAEFSPDGSRLLTAASDGTALIWEAPQDAASPSSPRDGPQDQASERLGAAIEPHRQHRPHDGRGARR